MRIFIPKNDWVSGEKFCSVSDNVTSSTMAPPSQNTGGKHVNNKSSVFAISPVQLCRVLLGILAVLQQTAVMSSPPPLSTVIRSAEVSRNNLFRNSLFLTHHCSLVPRLLPVLALAVLSPHLQRPQHRAPGVQLLPALLLLPLQHQQHQLSRHQQRLQALSARPLPPGQR